MLGIPLWFICAFTASLFSAAGMYMHQRLGGANTASAVWLKIWGLAVAGPMLFFTGVPSEPMFYVLTGTAAIIWCINDLIYFEAVKNHGAALLARLSPLGVITGFVAWFAVKPELLARYMEQWPRFAAICGVLIFCCLCAMALRRCPFSWQALKAIWFIIVAGAVGILLVKSAIDYAPENKGVFGYVGIEAAIMLLFYSVYFSIRRREAWRQVMSREGMRTGGVVGGLLVCGVVLRAFAFRDVDHPAFVTMLCMMDVVWLMIFTRLSGWKDESNKIAGLGIVLSALALAFLKI